MSRMICLNLMVLLVACSCVHGVDFDGGDGSSNNPWQISTEAQLLKVNEDVSACYVLVSDVYISGSYSDALISVDDSGTDSFSGTFDGDGYAIIDLAISSGSNDYVGLFGRVHSSGTIENLTLENVDIVGDVCVGSLVGRSDGDIENCRVINYDEITSMDVSGSMYIGGLIGLAGAGTVSDCAAEIGVSASNYHVGGLIGQNNAYVSDCSASGTVECTITSTTQGHVGGLVGWHGTSSIVDSFATGEVISSGVRTGGLVGEGNASGDSITNCYATGNVSYTGTSTGDVYIGGLVGISLSEVYSCYATGDVDGGTGGRAGGLLGHAGDITEGCYARGDVSGNVYIGGAVGLSTVEVTNCYSTGAVSGTSVVGGFMGRRYSGSVNDCFWDTSTSDMSEDYGIGQGGGDATGLVTVPGPSGLPSDTMTTQSTFTNAGWDFVNDWSMPMSENNGYPINNAYAIDFDGGDGTSNDPWQISNEDQLLKVNEDVSACYVLINDIKIYGSYSDALISANDAGTDSFSGTFDGNGYRIIDLVISGGSNDYVGLFGRVHSSGTIENLTLENVDIVGDVCVGSLVGRSDGDIENCRVINYDEITSMDVSGSMYIGGLIGLAGAGTVSDCAAEIGVSASNYHVGGLIGQNNAYVSDCSASGTVECTITSTTQGHTGGLVGWHGTSSIVDSFATGEVISSGVRTGGLVGEGNASGDSITNCYATGNVSYTGTSTGDVYIGGLVGISLSEVYSCYATGDVDGGTGGRAGGLLGHAGDITEGCYARGDVSGNVYIGGAVGLSTVEVTNCYSTGAVSGTSVVGGFMGRRYSGSVNDCFWDTQTSGLATGIGQGGGDATGKTTVLMRTESTFTDADWDFDDDWSMPIATNSQYPINYIIDFDDGDGSSDDPWLISNEDQLLKINEDVSASYMLMADIYLIGSYSDALIAAVDTSSGSFSGTFDGNGYKIIDLTITGSNDFVGLFGYIHSDGVVKNLTLEDIAVGGDECAGSLAGCSAGYVEDCHVVNDNPAGTGVSGSVYVGGLIGLTGAATVIDCTASVGVSASNYHVGGLIGQNNAYVSDCSASGTVESTINSTTQGQVGGLVGWHGTSSIIDSFALGEVISSGVRTGGLVGEASSSGDSIINCYAAGDVSYTGSSTGSVYIGGLIGMSITEVSFCYATGDVDSGPGDRAGGLMGQAGALTEDCYARGSVTGDGIIGGAVGLSTVGVTRCYSTGAVSGNSIVGGFMGWRYSGTVNDCFWDTQTSGQATGIGQGSGDAIGKTTALMQTESTFTDADWDFDDDWYMPMATNSQYPINNAYTIDFYGGDGSESSPWQISNEDQLLKVNENVGANYILVEDITLVGSYSGALIAPVDTSAGSFCGVFDGNGYTIEDLTITGSSDYVGLFGRVHNNGVVENLTLENVDIAGDEYVGSLVGRSDGCIIDCHVVNSDPTSTSVSGYMYVGGLIGLTGQGHAVSDCTAAVGVSATNNFVGGLIGQNNAYVWDCSASGTVESTIVTVSSSAGYAGGLIGWHGSSRLTDSYASGDVICSGSRTGGLVGEANITSESIINCYATGDVSYTGSGTTYGFICMGGLIGMSLAEVSSCYATGDVDAGSVADRAGGLMGQAGALTQDCYALGDVVGRNDIGGAIGLSTVAVANCYSTGAVSGSSNVGGFMGYRYAGTVTDCFWDTQTSGLATGIGQGGGDATGKTTALMQTESTFTDADWDFDDIWVINSGYPTTLNPEPVATWDWLEAGDLLWDDTIGLWSTTVGEDRLCSSWISAVNLLLAGRYSLLDNSNVADVLNALDYMTNDFGTIKTYYDEDAATDGNMTFFVCRALLWLKYSYGSELTSGAQVLLDNLLLKFRPHLYYQVSYSYLRYPNMYMGNLFCAKLVQESLSLSDPNVAMVEDKMLEAAQYYKNNDWGWGEHLSDGYSEVCIELIAEYLLLTSDDSDSQCYQEYKDLLDELFFIDDIYGGGRRMPALRSYALTGTMPIHSQRYYMKPWDSYAPTEPEHTLRERLLLNAEARGHGWSAIEPSAGSSQRDIAVPCYGGVVAQAYNLEHDIRLGTMSKYPLFDDIEWTDWGLSCICFPVALWQPQGDWIFMQWRTKYADEDEDRAHPNDYRGATVSLRSTNPQYYGRSYSYQNGGNALIVRIMPQIDGFWENVSDVFKIIDNTASSISNVPLDPNSRQLLLEYPDRTISLSVIPITDQCTPAVTTDDNITFWGMTRSDTDLAAQETYAIIDIWAISLDGEITQAPDIEIYGEGIPSRTDAMQKREVTWYCPNGEIMHIVIDPMTDNVISEQYTIR